MRKIRSMWEELQRSGCPDLRDDVGLEAGLALLDFYIMPCIEEFITCRGKLAPSTIVHLRNCKCELASPGLFLRKCSPAVERESETSLLGVQKEKEEKRSDEPQMWC